MLWRREHTRRNLFALGGWLFADLLLALTMLFLSATSAWSSPAKLATPTPAPQICGISQSPLMLTIAAPDAFGLRASPPTASSIESFTGSVRQELQGQANNVAGFVEVFGGSYAGSVDVGDGVALASGAISALRVLASQHFIFSQQTAYFKALWDGTLQSNQVAIYIFFFQLSAVCANH